MNKKSILLVGEHPFCHSGNGNMMQELLSRIDYSKYDVVCYVAGEADPALFPFFGKLPYTIIPSRQGSDAWGVSNLLRTLFTQRIDLIIMVGVDNWRYINALPELLKIKNMRGFKWASIMPYDSPNLRQDWVSFMMNVDYPSVYSEFGYNLVKPHISNITYFRPPLFQSELYRLMSPEEKAFYKSKFFPSVSEDGYIFGFIGLNQVRKEPHKVLEAFFNIKKKTKRKIHLYLHCELNGSFNLKQMSIDMGAETGDIITKTQNVKYPENDMAGIYNCLDCMVLPSMQEGLSWTILNAFLTQVPIVATETTAHIELLKGVYDMVPCNIDTLLPIETVGGSCHVKAKSCSVEDLTNYMWKMLNKQKHELVGKVMKGSKRAKVWLSGVTDINQFIRKALTVKPPVVKKKPMPLGIRKINDRVLFAQHSSGGDVLMTTRCFKGIKERYDNIPLDYMTSPQFMNIVEGNPYLDKIIPWTDEALKNYEFVVNPHGERILPGHWGRNANSLLGDFYWKILMVEPTDFYVKLVPTDHFRINLKEQGFDYYDFIKKDGLLLKKAFIVKDTPIYVVHTTGGDPHFRTYKYMDSVCYELNKKGVTIQVGGKNDYPAKAAIDFRGKLTYQQTAFVMSFAKVVVSVDSFISHLAGALGLSQVALYGSGNASVCQPVQCGGKLITLAPDYIKDCWGLGPCSAAVRECPKTCTGSHNPKTILEAIKEIENEVQTGILMESMEVEHE